MTVRINVYSEGVTTMKREYRKPVIKFIDYTYDEQVVAQSSQFDGLGDGFQISYCTWESGSFSSPCLAVLSKSDKDGGLRCYDFTPWSLRG